jgi:hypothetical protein
MGKGAAMGNPDSMPRPEPKNSGAGPESREQPVPDGSKGSGLVGKILVPVLIALLTGGSAPFWWHNIFPEKSSDHVKDPTSSHAGAGPSAIPQEVPPPSPRLPPGGTRAPLVLESAAPHFEKFGIQFDLQQCAVSQTSVVCAITMTSPETDIELDIGSPLAGGTGVPTMLYDQRGGSFLLGPLRVANQNGFGRLIVSLVRGVPTIAEATFEVKTDVTAISLLKFTCADTRGKTGIITAEYRDFHSK